MPSMPSAYMKAWRDSQPSKEKAYAYLAMRRWAENNMQKVLAKNCVYRALRAGRLIRPEACESCGNKPEKNRAGQTQIQAHHEDYALRLSVKWLCRYCHEKAHHGG